MYQIWILFLARDILAHDKLTAKIQQQIRGFALLDAPMNRTKPLTEDYVHK